jgi:hypothetical protein
MTLEKRNLPNNIVYLLSDLVFVCSDKIQIWTNQRDAGFKLAQTATLPAGAGPLSFGDIGKSALCK